MSPAPFLPIVFMVLLLAALAYLLFRGPAAPRSDGRKSTLARDGGDGGNWYLLPAEERAAVLDQRKAQRRR